MDRRNFLSKSAVTAIGGAVILQSIPSELFADDGVGVELDYDSAIKKIANGRTIADGASIITLNIPDKPENANLVPVEVTVKSPMSQSDYIKTFYVLTTKNKFNMVVTANYTPAMGQAYLFITAKLGSAQDMVVVVEDSKGRLFKASKSVEVEAAGCG